MSENGERHAAAEAPPGAPLVVGIGASAGGLEVLEELFSKLPSDGGITYVVIQHLAPQHTSMLGQILGRHTSMPVVDATDGALAEPDHVYVIAPGTLLAICGGAFQARYVDSERHPQIDVFLQSLAEDRGPRAVGIVLSGSGTDGVEGLRAIKERGGLTLAQRPETARYDSMPKSAIDAGVVDHVLAVDEMPAKLVERARGAPIESAARAPTPVAPAPLQDADLLAALGRVHEALRRATGHDFSHYKSGTLVRRLRRRLQMRHRGPLAEYLDLLERDPIEPELLAKEMLIGVTQFFRDSEAFDYLAAHVLPVVLAPERAAEGVRIWCAGCATGEEAYSLGILVRERIAEMADPPRVQIFATDIDGEAIYEARSARYPADIAARVTPERLARFFAQEGASYVVTREVREMCIFSQHSLIRDPPLLAVDLLVCRNVLIYLDAALQKRLVPIFHYALRRGGYLFLGPSEGLTAHSELFETMDKRARVFRRAESVQRRLVEFPLAPRGAPRTSPPSPLAPPSAAAEEHAVNAAFERLVLQEYAPPGAVVNERGEVICVAGLTGRYLQPPAGVLTTNVFDIAHAGLRIELRTALHVAARTGKRVVRDDVEIDDEGRVQRLRLTVRPLPGARQEGLYAVILQAQPVTAPEPDAMPAGSAPVIEHLESELHRTRANLRTTIEQLESSNEELKSSNEELLSTNEEMQSANEELQSSQEELKSLNEELATVNAELGRKVDELARANADLQNLFSSTDVATLFLDRDQRVTRFTPAAKALFRLIDADVGRPIAHLAPRFVEEDLVADVDEVLRTLRTIERHVVTMERGAWYLLRVMPYRTAEGRIGGAVITLADITQIKRAEADLRRLATVVIDANDAVTVLDLEGRILDWNRAAERMYGYTADEARGMNVITLVLDGDREATRALLDAIRRGEAVASGEVKRRTKDGRTLDVWLTMTKLVDERGAPVGATTTERDVTAQKRADAQLRADLDATSRLLRLGSRFLRTGVLQDVFDEALDTAIAIAGADFGNLQVLNRETGHLEIVAQRGFSAAWLSSWGAATDGRGACWAAMERGERVVVEDVEASPLFVGTPLLAVQRECGVRAVQSTPLTGRGHRPLGVLSTHWRAPAAPDERVLRLIDLVARQVADILDRAHVQEELQAANQRLVDADRRKNEFLGMLSHELRNPLAPIRNSIYILDHATPGGEQARRAQAVIARQVGHLTRLVDDLLDITRITHGKIQLQREALDLDDLARRTVEDHRAAFVAADVALEVVSAPKAVVVSGDRTRLSQVIGNLLQNALKFTPAGGKATVEVEADEARALAVLCVKDSGRGVAPELLPRLFEPFAQADASLDRQKGGLGLGLSVVKGLVEKHGGTVAAASWGAGEGATFTIMLPLVPTAAPARGRRAADGGGPRRVMIIEDNVDAAMTLCEMLELSGHTVEVAHTGREGIMAARRFGPDLVICDIGLPEMDGFEVARAMRRDASLQGVVMIALTGYAGPDDVAKAKAAGFDEHLAKPLSVEALEGVLGRLPAR